jgi:transcriptional repressor of cell division inhibition gene dicB
MRKTDVVRHFGSQKAVSEALEISESAVSQWGELIPPLQAHKLAELTRGELSFDPRLYRHSSERSREIASALSS